MQNNIKQFCIEIDITHVCNYTCQGCNRLCNIPKCTKDTVMTLDDVKNIVAELLDYNVKHINVMGGEPCTNPYVYDICSYLCNIFQTTSVVLVSNGFFSDKINQLKNIKKLGFRIKKNPEEIAKKYYINPFDKRNFVDKEDYYNCRILCDSGLCIYKENNQILWSKCANSMYISRFLGIENKYSKNTLAELIQNVNDKDFFKDICHNCAFYCSSWSQLSKKYKDFSIVDDIFKTYLQKIQNC